MSRRKMYILLSAVSLMLGVTIYILFRENSYIGIVFGRFSLILVAREMLEWLSCDFLKFYLPDYLWGFSLCCGLHAIYTPERNGSVICTGIAILCGCAWEWMQYEEIVSGTGDICDVLMYLLAGLRVSSLTLGVKEMKKVNLLLLTVLIIALFAAFAMGSGEEPTVDQGSGSASTESKVEGAIGDYAVVIDSCRLAEDFEGSPVVIVKYIFTNVSDDDAAAFFTTFEEHVYQNGVSLNEAYFLDDSAQYSSDNQTKEIKKGASIEVEIAYKLNDTTTDIEVEVTEFISFNDAKITKSFSITE